MRRLLPLLFLSSLSMWADPIFWNPGPGPIFPPPGDIVTIDLGNGLIWSGPQMTQEEWDQRMAGLPTGPLLAPFDAPPIEPGLLSPQRQVPPIGTVPEPATMTLVAAGLIAAALLPNSRATLKAWGARGSTSMESSPASCPLISAASGSTTTSAAPRL